MNLSDIYLVPYLKKNINIWNNLVLNSRNGNFLHHQDYLSYHANRFNNQSLIIFKRNRPIAVFPANRINDCIISHSGLTYGGLIYGNEVRFSEVFSIIQKLGEYFRSLGCRSLLYKAIPSIFHRYPAQEDLYALWRLGARIVRRDLSNVVQLDKPIVWSKSRINNIRKAQKIGLSIRDFDFVEDFHSLLVETLSKHRVTPVHSLNELQLLKSRFPDSIRFFGAFSGDRLVASALIYDFGKLVHSQYLASSEHGRSVGALDYLLAHLLTEIFSHKRYFSFGISTDNQGHDLNEGLLFQKESFGGRAVVHVFMNGSFECRA